MSKITLDLPKGSPLEMDVRRYVASKIEAQGVEIKRLKDIKITAEYVPQDGTSLRSEVVEART